MEYSSTPKCRDDAKTNGRIGICAQVIALRSILVCVFGAVVLTCDIFTNYNCVIFVYRKVYVHVVCVCVCVCVLLSTAVPSYVA